MTIQRYEDEKTDYEDYDFFPNPDGRWCKWEDVEFLLDKILNCYSPDDTIGDYQDKIKTLFE